ncbi:MAG: Lrp/AsnC family transcriptional regulator [Leucobacter sp.]
MNHFQLDESDRLIIRELTQDGRIPYKELAARTGLPVSTCHGRVRALEKAGIIRGYRAEIEPVAAGADVQALISLTVRGTHRNIVPDVAAELARIPGVQSVFLLGGDRDIVAHVACASVTDLRQLIQSHLGAHPALDQTHTQIVFEHIRGTRPLV